MRLLSLTWPEAESAWRQCPAAIWPWGSTEQHGPVGRIGTDALTAEAIALAAGAQLDVPVLPTQAIGMAQHHLGFAGSMTLRPTTLIAIMLDVIASLARHEVRHVLIVNGHGGNVATINAGLDEVASRSTLELRRVPICGLHNWWAGEQVTSLVQDLYGAGEGDHATASELSIVAYLEGQVDSTNLPAPNPAPPFQAFHDAEDYRRLYPDGRIGADARLTDPSHGPILIDAAVADTVAAFRAMLARHLGS